MTSEEGVVLAQRRRGAKEDRGILWGSCGGPGWSFWHLGGGDVLARTAWPPFVRLCWTGLPRPENSCLSRREEENGERIAVFGVNRPSGPPEFYL